VSGLQCRLLPFHPNAAERAEEELMNRSTGLLLFRLGLACCILTLPVTVQADSAAEPSAAASTQNNVPTTAEAKLSQAERILRLEKTIADTQAELEEIKKDLDDPKSEYAQAKEAFMRLDKRLEERQQEAASRPAGEAPDLTGLQRARELAKERFDLAIAERAALQQKFALLEKKLEQDLAALNRMRNPETATSKPAEALATEVKPEQEQAGPTPAAQPAPPQATIQVPAVPGVPAPAAPASPAASQTGSEAPPLAQTALPDNKELLEAQQKAHVTKTEAKKAAEQLQSITERIATVRDNIKTEESLLDTARQRAVNARKSYNSVREHVEKLLSTGAPTEQVSAMWARVDDAEARAGEAEAEVNKIEKRIGELRSELDDLQSEHITALEDAERKRSQAAEAEQEVRRLQNPFSLFNILQWLIRHGPPVAGIGLAMTVLLWLTKVVEQRIVRLITIRGDAGGEPEREARAKTLAAVFRNFASTAIVIGGMLMILSEVGINIVPLLGAAGVVGLAVAFGAQSLIKDYFSGFIILLENQYAINDVIRIGNISGMVEHISLRMTKLRDIEGNAHFIPHGEIKSVTNMTHGWSRAVLDIRVAYKEQVDRVMAALMEVANELYRDPVFRPLVLDAPEMVGVDNLGESAVIVRLMIKTRPLRQWMVKREMLRRIKNRFDELGIEIPFPHYMVYHRPAADDSSDPDALAPLPGRSHDN